MRVGAEGFWIGIQVYIAPVLDEKSKISGGAMDDDKIGTSLSGAHKGGSGKPEVQ